ncbi:alpha/beta-hydrolase [Trametopsis cervina]|nr:alpha/beta-hydrolase [Trametopsis cervina]
MHRKLHVYSVVGCVLPYLAAVGAQDTGTFPHSYPGEPQGDFGPVWQNYFQVTQPLPNASFPLGRNWAGNIPVNRAGSPANSNNTLFFWAWEKENGSLTAAAGERENEPWGIWLNGGPGSSSLVGMLFENGPLHVADDYSLFSNNFSWHTQADYIWVDQPVGVGFGTVDKGGFVADEDQMGLDFFGFLTNLVKVFPSLKTRPFYLTGESYAGTYIPYITKTYFGLADPPVKLTRIAIGDGAIGSGIEFEILPALSVIETYPQLIGYDTDVFEYFKTQNHLCGFDLNLTYPQVGNFPTLSLLVKPGFEGGNALAKTQNRALKTSVLKQSLKANLFDTNKRDLSFAENEHTVRRLQKRDAWKRDLTNRPNGTVDTWYGCDLFDELVDYALNFSIPWKGNDFGGFDVYDLQDALDPEAPMDASVFLNDNRTRTAIHAPTSVNWEESVNYLFGGSIPGIDPSVEPMAFLDDLATNASKNNVGVVIYSGNDDSLVAHISSQIVIQNTTFGGVQGFTRVPSTPWFDDTGAFAGIVHQERNWTYVLVDGAGHLVPQKQPGRAFVLLREFILGSNTTGLVVTSGGSASVVGGENATLAAPILPGASEVFAGSGTTQSTFVYPSATIAAWESFIATATATGSGSGTGGAGGAAQTQASAASSVNGVGSLSSRVLGAVVATGMLGLLVL